MKQKVIIACIVLAILLLLVEVGFIIKQNRGDSSQPAQNSQSTQETNGQENQQPEPTEEPVPTISLPEVDSEQYPAEEETFDGDDGNVTFPAEHSGAENSTEADADSNELEEIEFE